MLCPAVIAHLARRRRACLSSSRGPLANPDLPLHSVLAVALNANRHVTGTLRGFDQFMNLVLDNTVDDKTKSDIGMVVSCWRTSLHVCCQSHCCCIGRKFRCVGISCVLTNAWPCSRKISSGAVQSRYTVIRRLCSP